MVQYFHSPQLLKALGRLSWKISNLLGNLLSLKFLLNCVWFWNSLTMDWEIGLLITEIDWFCDVGALFSLIEGICDSCLVEIEVGMTESLDKELEMVFMSWLLEDELDWRFTNSGEDEVDPEF